MDRNLLAHPRKRAAFTLIETLLVVTIISILVGLTVIQASSSIGTINMKQAISTVIGTLERARQLAMTTNKEVIVRIYKMSDETGAVAWRAIEYGNHQIISDPANPLYQAPGSPNFEPVFQKISTTERLPRGFIFHPSIVYSTLLDRANTALISGTEVAPDGTNRDFISFVCKPAGRAELPTTSAWTLTLVKENEQLIKGDQLPSNFATLQLEPRTSRLTVYRP